MVITNKTNWSSMLNIMNYLNCFPIFFNTKTFPGKNFFIRLSVQISKAFTKFNFMPSYLN